MSFLRAGEQGRELRREAGREVARELGPREAARELRRDVRQEAIVDARLRPSLETEESAEGSFFHGLPRSGRPM